jgi:hypothetical protein
MKMQLLIVGALVSGVAVTANAQASYKKDVPDQDRREDRHRRSERRRDEREDHRLRARITRRREERSR